MARRNKGGWWTAERQQRAYQVLREKAGLTDAGARGLVSRWANVEAREGPTAKNPNSGAIGIGQWLGDRKPNSLDFEAQLEHAVAELNGREKRAGDLLRSAETLEEGAIGASAYERAEGYDSRTKRDNYVNATLRGMPNIAAPDAGYMTASYNPNAEAATPAGLGAYALGDPTANAGPAGRAYSDLVAPQSVQTTSVGGLGAEPGPGLAALAPRGLIENYGPNRPNRPSEGILSIADKAVKGVLGDSWSVVGTSGTEGDLPQYGSDRHKSTKALDFYAVNTETGVPASRAQMAQVAQQTAALGATGVGFGAGYMDKDGIAKIHVDTAHPNAPRSWGAGGTKSTMDPDQRASIMGGMLLGTEVDPFGATGGLPVPADKPGTALASNEYAPGLTPAALTRDAPAQAPMSPGAAVAMGLGGLRNAPAELGRADIDRARANTATDGSPYSGPGSTFSKAEVDAAAAARQLGPTAGVHLGMGGLGAALAQPAQQQGPNFTGSAVAPDFAPDMNSITGLMSREFTGSPQGLGAFAPRAETADRVKGGLRVGGLQPLGATEALAGQDVTPPNAAMMAPDMMGTGSLTPPGAPMPNFQRMQPTIAPPNAPSQTTIAAPDAAPQQNTTVAAPDQFPDAPAPPSMLDTARAKMAVGLDSLGLGGLNQIGDTFNQGLGSFRQALSQGLGGGPAAMGGPNYGSGLAAMQQAMSGPPGGMAQSRSNPGYSFQKTNTGGVRYGPKGWQALDENGEQSGGLHSYDGESQGLGGFFSGLFGGLGSEGKSKSKSKDKDKDRGGLGGSGYSGRGLY